MPAPQNVFTGGWYTFQNPVDSLPTLGSGQSSRLDDRYTVLGFDFVGRLLQTNYGGGFPINLRIIGGVLR